MNIKSRLFNLSYFLGSMLLLCNGGLLKYSWRTENFFLMSIAGVAVAFSAALLFLVYHIDKNIYRRTETDIITDRGWIKPIK